MFQVMTLVFTAPFERYCSDTILSVSNQETIFAVLFDGMSRNSSDRCVPLDKQFKKKLFQTDLREMT
jgi:hypothetical protein